MNRWNLKIEKKLLLIDKLQTLDIIIFKINKKYFLNKIHKAFRKEILHLQIKLSWKDTLNSSCMINSIKSNKPSSREKAYINIDSTQCSD